MIKRILVASYFTLCCTASWAGTVVERPDWQQLFDDYGVRGVFVLCSLKEESCQSSHMVRASERFIPASTFKILNSLIGLETQVITDGREVFKWNGIGRPYKAWDRDFMLRGAMQNSVVPIYQDIALKVGEARMQKYLRLAAYGNADISGGIDRFWLDGGLRISALEQIEFLTSLYLDRLPFTERNQMIVKQAMLSEATHDYVLRSKTGYSLGMPGYGDTTKPGVAWWVGWIEADTGVTFFAANFDIEKNDQLAARKDIPMKILKMQGILQ